MNAFAAGFCVGVILYFLEVRDYAMAGLFVAFAALNGAIALGWL